MENILSYVEFVRWAISPVGLLIVVAISGLLLSGLPGAIMPNVEATAAVRSHIHPQPSPGSETTRHHRERMDA